MRRSRGYDRRLSILIATAGAVKGGTTVPWDYAAVAEQNRQNLKNLGDGQSLNYAATRNEILIGDGHPQECYDAMQAADDDPASNVFRGTVTIEKGGLTDPGSLTFVGYAYNRGELEQHIASFSKKRVLYAD